MNSDILSVLDDIINHWHQCESLTEKDILNHTIDILKQIYKPKEIFDHYIRQHIYYKFPHLCNTDDMIFNESDVMKEQLRKQVIELQKVPLPENHEWFEFRKSRITASELATIFNANSFMTKDELILAKCGYSQEMDEFALEICQHGVIFEPIATELYEKRNKTTVIEFGCLPHPNYDYIAHHQMV